MINYFTSFILFLLQKTMLPSDGTSKMAIKYMVWIKVNHLLLFYFFDKFIPRCLPLKKRTVLFFDMTSF